MTYRVLHLVDSLGLYGAERVILNLSLELKNSMFFPVVGILMEKTAAKNELEVTARELGLMTSSIRLGRKFSPMNVIVLANFLKRHDIAIVNSHGYKPTILGFLAAFMLNIPLITTCHLWSEDDWKLRLYFRLESVVLKFLPAVIGVSEEICEEIAARGVKRDNIILIHNGINLSNYRTFPSQSISLLKRELKIGSDDFVIGTMGRLTPQKGYRYLIDAVKMLVDRGKKIKCIVLGDGYLRTDLEEAREGLGLTSAIMFLGFREDAVQILDVMDAFVMTSIDEGLPMALLEAMAKGKPVISTPVGAIDKVINHGTNGLLYAVGDVSDLVHHLLSICNDRGLANKLGKAAKDTVERQFSSKIMARKYSAVYRTVLFGNVV